MKRILGVVVAIAGMLSFSSAAVAATIVFDLSGVTGVWSRSTDTNAEIPGPLPDGRNGGVCASGMESAPAPVGGGNNCFRYAFQAGSSMTVDITGSAVTLLGGVLNVSTFTLIGFDSVSIATNSVNTINGGATGTLVGNNILWSSPVTNTLVGTMVCGDVGVPTFNCLTPLGLVAGQEYPVQLLSLLTATTPVAAMNFGTWQLNAARTQIVGSSTVITARANQLTLDNRNSGAYTFGEYDLGLAPPIYAPEPGSAALVLLGLGALALRSRKA